MTSDLITRLEETIDSRLSDSAFGAKELALHLGISHSKLLKKVRSLTGKSINQLIKEYRLKKALEMLQTEDMTVAEVAEKTGFRSPSYFATCFRKQYGFSPGDAKTAQNIDSSEENETKGSRQKKRRVLIAASSVIILLTVVLIILISTGTLSRRTSIAVIPFRPNGQSEEERQLTGILWEQLITSLSQVEAFDVRSSTSSSQFGDAPISEIRRELRVDYAIEGSVSLIGDSAGFRIQLIRTKTDDHFFVKEYFIPISGFEKNQKMADISEHIAYQLNTVLKPSERSAILLRCSESDEAIANYRLGNSFMNYSEGISPWEALPYYRKAIELDSMWMGPYIQLSEALRAITSSDPKQEYFEERLKAIERVHEIQPGLASNLWLGRYYKDVGNTKQSLKYFNKARKISPDNPSINFYFGIAAMNFGRWNEAEQMLMDYYRERPEFIQIIWRLGQISEMQRDFPKAQEYFNRGTLVKPEFSISYYNLADIELKWKGDPKAARKILEDAIKMEPWIQFDPIRAYYIYTLANIFEGKYEDALGVLSKWFMVPGEHYPPYNYHPKYLYYAMVYGYMGNHDLERAYYDSTRLFVEKRMEESPFLENKLTMQSCLGMAYAGLGDTVSALEIANKVKKLHSRSTDHFKGPYAIEDVAWIYTKTGNYSKALKTIKQLLSKPGPLTARLLEIDPKWQALRDQQGYQKLIDKYTIPIVEVPQEVKDSLDNKPKAPEIGSPSFTDERDGNSYHFNQIGTQTWMLENLAYLPDVSVPDSSSYTDKNYYVYDYHGTNPEEAKESDNYKVYGVLYNWEAAISVCPSGWHLPSDEEWKILEKYLGMSEEEVDMITDRESESIGKKIKYSSGWHGSGNGDNSAGFYAIPGGFLHFNHTYMDLEKNAGWWTSTAIGKSAAMIRNIPFNSEGVNRMSFDKRGGLSVRCLKD